MAKHTPFYNCHVKAKGKIVEFAGYELPIQYEGLIAEHEAVRNSVGVFDVSHMGEAEVKGEKAFEFLQKITTNNVSRLVDGQVQYSAMCYEDGGIVDDILVHRFNENHFFLCINASNVEKDIEWMEKNNTEGVTINNLSDKYGQLAIQGPKCEELLQTLTSIDLSKIDRYFFTTGELANLKDLIIARTGYTGEDGFEIYCTPDQAEALWNAIFDAGNNFGLKPCGLGARDTLRLEVRYCLYGNDITKDTTPFEAGLGWIVSKKKGDFIGKSAMDEKKAAGHPKKLVGIEMVDKGIARKDYEVFDADGNKIGFVTSGTFSPTLKKPVALAYIQPDKAKIDNELFVEIRSKKAKIKVIKTPFVTGTSLDKFMKK